jgi:hypothetical protein
MPLGSKWRISSGFNGPPSSLNKQVLVFMSNRNTTVLLDLGEIIYNPHFNPANSGGFRKQAGLSSFVISF